MTIKPEQKTYKKLNCPECQAEVNIINDSYYAIVGHISGCSLAGKSKDAKPRIDIYDRAVTDEYDGVGKRPYRYQEKGIEFLTGKERFDRKYGALFWEMRLGKTPTSIKAFKKNGCKKVLVVCPKSVINNWLMELEEEQLPALQIDTVSIRHPAIKSAVKKMDGWYVTNYETLLKIDLSNMNWDGVILDESDKVKDHRTKTSQELAGAWKQKKTGRTKIIRDRLTGETKEIDETVKVYIDKWRKIKHRCILTGTPAPENLLNYFQQLKFLFPEGEVAGIDNYESFKNRFFESDGPNKWKPKFSMDLMLSKMLAEDCFVLKRDQVGIGSKKVYEVRETELSPEYQEEYNTFQLLWLTKDFEIDVQHALAAFIKLHRLSGGYDPDLMAGKRNLQSPHKINELRGLLRNDLKNERVVIWFNFRNELAKVASHLPKDSWVAWTGNTSQEKRKVIEDEFAFKSRDLPSNGKVRHQYLLCQIHSAMQGLDFAACDQEIYFSNPLGSKARTQSEDRIIHPEKQVPLLVIDLVAANTICPEILKRLKDKELGQQEFLAKIHQSMRNK